MFARNRVATSEIVWRYGVPCLNIHRSLFDEVVRRGTAQAGAAAIDMVLYAELTSLRRFTAWLGTVRDVPGVPLVRRAVALSVEGVESPQESRLRFAWMFGAGLPEPLCNMDVHSTSGAFLARPDLFSPELGLIGEYDGEVHSGAAARGHDHTRVDRLRDHGLEVVSVVGGQLDEREVVKRLRAAARRAQRSQVERDWVLHGPNGPRPPLDWRIDARLSWLSSKRRELQLRDMPGPM
ncbi:hypothetical protein [Nocardioides alcanivorans]|uniref:hypothetical protein n=1 Tax=Nocardioides alcanivorans TaxID=2897352 RepID=UPI001F2D606E|nr:hypothetical protein [Nocardioides alcanivorans]